MQEIQIRDILEKGLPKISIGVLSCIYPMKFLCHPIPSHDKVLNTQVVATQLVYTKSIQVLAYLDMATAQIMSLGQTAFPKYSRLESPKKVISANSEALNSIMAKVSYLISKLDIDTGPVLTPPFVINCSGKNIRSVEGKDSLFFNLSSEDITMLLIVSVQMV